jgi:hypothetical protein
MLGLRSCFAAVMLLLPAGVAMGNLIADPGFDGGISGWTLLHTEPTDTAMTATWLSSGGNPGATVEFERIGLPVASDGHRFYYTIPVTQGRYYRLSGDWKGSIKGDGTGANWAEIRVGYSVTSTPTTAEFGSRLGSGHKRWDPVATASVGVDQETGAWDWERFPGAWRQATAGYMVISFNLGGTVDAAGSISYMIDNLAVIECSALVPGDVNGDCQMNIADLAMIAANWMNCTVDPASSCWQ